MIVLLILTTFRNNKNNVTLKIRISENAPFQRVWTTIIRDLISHAVHDKWFVTPGSLIATLSHKIVQ